MVKKKRSGKCTGLQAGDFLIFNKSTSYIFLRRRDGDPIYLRNFNGITEQIFLELLIQGDKEKTFHELAELLGGLFHLRPNFEPEVRNKFADKPHLLVATFE